MFGGPITAAYDSPDHQQTQLVYHQAPAVERHKQACVGSTARRRQECSPRSEAAIAGACSQNLNLAHRSPHSSEYVFYQEKASGYMAHTGIFSRTKTLAADKPCPAPTALPLNTTRCCQ